MLAATCAFLALDEADIRRWRADITCTASWHRISIFDDGTWRMLARLYPGWPSLGVGMNC